MSFIPNADLWRLNWIATRNGKNSLTDGCPVMALGHNAPILLALPGIESPGWVRCVLPAKPDCTVHVCLDVRLEDYYQLPVHPACRRDS